MRTSIELPRASPATQDTPHRHLANQQVTALLHDFAGSLVSGPTTAAPDGLLRRVQSVTTSAGTTTYTAQPATPAQVVTNVPDAVSNLPLAPVAEQITGIDPGVTVGTAPAPLAKVPARTFSQPRGLAAVDAPTLNLTLGLTKDLTIPGTGQTLTLKVNGPMTVTPRAVFQFDADWGQVKQVEMRAGFQTTSNLNWSVSTPVGSNVAGTLSHQWSLLTVERWYGAFIGPIPVSVRVTLELVAEFSASGKLILSWKSSTSGELTAGLRATAPSLGKPVPVVTTPTGTSTGPVLTLEGTERAAVGGALKIFLYGVAGPTGQLGVEGKARAFIDTAGNRGCTAPLGPHATVGLNASFAVLGFTWQLQLWQPALSPWRQWNGCGTLPPPPAPPTAPLNMTPTSGIAGDRIRFDSATKCPPVPEGYFQQVQIMIRDS